MSSSVDTQFLKQSVSNFICIYCFINNVIRKYASVFLVGLFHLKIWGEEVSGNFLRLPYRNYLNL